MSLPAALPPDTVIGGHYRIGNLLNSGGFGAVYRAVDLSEGQRPCAVKETYDVTPAARRRALLEAGVLFTLRSDHLPAVYDAFEANGRFYLVMQLIEGQNLLQVLQARIGSVPLGEQPSFQLPQGPCHEQEVLTWLLPIMDVLQDLHSRKPPILHRDIKPGNIILTPQQTTVLVDFGLTRLYDPKVNTQTLGRVVTPGFSPLEQYVGKTSPQSDIYALAATMYLLLTNRLPPPATARTPYDPLLPPRQLNLALSPKVERALLKALALHADERFDSMGAFAEALREPGFSAFADRTEPFRVSVSVPPLPVVQPTQPAVSQTMPAAPSPAPRITGAYVAVQPPAGMAGIQPVQKVQPLQPASATPTGASQVLAPAQGMSYTPLARPLPGSFGQGCLWGLIQGVLGALLVLSLRQMASFYLATLMGFVFYMLAGFLTARRGGSAWRGAWAGYWAGISSTLMFWIVLWVGILTLAAQYLRNFGGPPTADDFRQAIAQVSPQFPGFILLPTQPAWINLLILLGGGLLLATALGGYGGRRGQRYHKMRMARRQTR